MKHIYYLIGVFFIIYELMWILSPKKSAKSTQEFKELGKENKGKKWDDMSEDYKDLFISKGIPALVMTIWLVAGIMTFNWFPFIGKLLWNLVIIAPISTITRFSTAYTVLHWFNSLVGFSFGIFVIVNSYHLKVNVYELFIQWLGY